MMGFWVRENFVDGRSEGERSRMAPYTYSAVGPQPVGLRRQVRLDRTGQENRAWTSILDPPDRLRPYDRALRFSVLAVNYHHGLQS